MNLWISALATCTKATCFIVFGAILILPFQKPACGQITGGGTSGSGTNSPIVSQGIAGSDVVSSDITSKMKEMPRFSGFDRLDKTIYIGGTSTYFAPRMSTGQKLTNQQTSSGNTRSITTGSRTTSSLRNRNMSTMGNTGRMGGLGGATNTIRSVTSLGYSFNEAKVSAPTGEVRTAQIENRINNNSKIAMIAPITVEIENSTAILRGIVKNEHERRLLEQFVKLEPGIYRVKNELTLPIISE